jgi:hypothetical protein
MMNCLSGQNREDGVFNRSLHTAGVLDNAADELTRTWFGYDWNDRTRCNCGVVARQVMQASAVELKKLLPPIYEDGDFRSTWGTMTETYCPETGLSENVVFSELAKAGFRVSDFSHLEELSHPAILKRMACFRREKGPVCRSRKSDVIAYLRGWAVGIEEHHDRPAVESRSLVAG